MKKKIGYAIDILLILVISAATLWLLFKDNGIETFISDVKSAEIGWLIIGFILVLVFVCSESVIIKYMLKMFDVKIPLLRCIKYSFIGFFVSYITPSSSGGQPAQIYYMRKDGVSVGHSTLIMVVIAFTYKLVLVLLGAFFLIFRFNHLIDHVGSLIWLVILGFVLNLAFIALLGLLVIKPYWTEKFLLSIVHLLACIKIFRHEEKWREKVINICKNYKESAEYIKGNPGKVGIIMLITAVQRISLFAVTYIVYKSFGLSGTGFVDIIALQTLIAVAVEMLPLPGAAGITEGCFLGMFNEIFGRQTVKSALIMSRSLSFYIVLILGGIVTGVTQIINVKKDINREKLK